MCTVTYIPKEDGFLITSNRDEDRERIAHPPKRHVINERPLYFPQDSFKGGSWIATSEKGHTACLLNGAFERHTPDPPYRMSRGLILIEYFNYHNVEAFLSHTSFERVEPFTIVIFGNERVEEIRWDGKEVFEKKFSAGEPGIWSSASLYTEETQRKRAEIFYTHLEQNPDPGVDEMLELHTFDAPEEKGGMLIEREGKLRTVSITSVRTFELHTEMVYRDRQIDWEEKLNIPVIAEF